MEFLKENEIIVLATSLVAIFSVLMLLFALWIRRALLTEAAIRSAQHDSLVLLQNQMNSNSQQSTLQMEQLRSSLLQISTGITRSLDTSGRTVSERLDGAAKVIGNVNHQLGQLQQANQRIMEIGQDVSQLQQILQSPKLRGNLSELFLGDLLNQILPEANVQMQYKFEGGETVDAVVKLKAGLVPIDAKFPLDNFRKMIQAEDETTRAAHRKTFMKDVKGHIDAVATKYIRADEGTFDFALMYIPAENVYYEIIIRDKETASLLPYALNKRVIPVAPNNLYAYLQTILLGLKGMRIDENARAIMDGLSRLRKEHERFYDQFKVAGQHLDNSVKKFAEADKRLGMIEKKLDQVDGVISGIPAQTSTPAES